MLHSEIAITQSEKPAPSNRIILVDQRHLKYAREDSVYPLCSLTVLLLKKIVIRGAVIHCTGTPVRQGQGGRIGQVTPAASARQDQGQKGMTVQVA